MNDEVIVSNQAQCLVCGDKPFSAHVHDYKMCFCGNVAVDGGVSYLKRSVRDKEKYKNLSIVLERSLINDLIEAVRWARESDRNDLGAVYAVLRAIRDAGYEVTKKD